MSTTADYLNQLRTDKQALVDNLNTQGVPASSNETFTTLVPKVLDIVGGAGNTHEVSSIAEMEALTDVSEDDYCVVIESVPRIPNAYQEVEYLQGTGTQYIDTGYAPYKTKSEVRFQKLSSAPTYEYVMAGWNANNNRYYSVAYNHYDNYFITLDRNNSSTNLGAYNSNVHTVIYNDENNKVKYDGIVKATVSDLTTQGTNSIYLFANHAEQEPQFYFKGRIYYVKITDKDTNTLVRDFVPCYRKSDNEIGMYDTVNDVFYTNQGTGVFTKGSDVENPLYTLYQYRNSSWVQVGEELLYPSTTVTPTTTTQILNIPNGYMGLKNVTVNGVNSSIDANILPENIRAGVTVLNIAGNLEPDKPDQSKTVDPTTSIQNIRPDTGYELASVTVNAVTAAIDSNIVAGNIKKDVSILGVLGTLEGSVDTGAYKVSSVEEMNAIEGMEENDLCVINSDEVPAKSTSDVYDMQYWLDIEGFILPNDISPDTHYIVVYERINSQGYGAYAVPKNSSNNFFAVSINGTSDAYKSYKYPKIAKDYYPSMTGSGGSLNVYSGSPSGSAISKYFCSESVPYSKTLDTTVYNSSSTSWERIIYSNIDLYFWNASTSYKYLDTSKINYITDYVPNTYRVFKFINSIWSEITETILYNSISVTPTTSSQTLPIPDGYRGFKNVIVNAVPLETKTVDPSTSVQNITPNSPNLGFSNITVNAVTSNIDPNIMANNIKSGVNILGVQGNFAGIDTSDANATPINIRDGRTAYVNGVKITGNLPVVTYPVDPEDPENWDYQFIAATACNYVTRDNINYYMGAYQIANSSQPDSWMFEGNRKMKLGIPESMIANTIGFQERTIRKGAIVGGITGIWNGESGEDSGIYEVSSTTEMNNLTTMEEGDLCIVETPSGTLPSGYTEVKYIENQKNAYINTGISASATTQTEMRFCFLDPTNTQNSVIHGIIGGQDKSGSNYIRYVPVYLSISGMGPINSSYGYTVSSQDYYKPHTLVYNDANGKTYFDGVEDTPSGYMTGSITNKIFVFGLNDTTDSSKLITSTSTLAKIYYLKLKDNSNNTLLRDFVPCIRVSDGAVGLYDKVSNTFFGNEGTGNALMAGPIISTKSVYQYSNGAWSTVSGGPSQEAEALVDEIINGTEEE